MRHPHDYCHNHKQHRVCNVLAYYDREGKGRCILCVSCVLPCKGDEVSYGRTALASARQR
jgi:hypothetical protein